MKNSLQQTMKELEHYTDFMKHITDTWLEKQERAREMAADKSFEIELKRLMNPTVVDVLCGLQGIMDEKAEEIRQAFLDKDYWKIGMIVDQSIRDEIKADADLIADELILGAQEDDEEFE